MPFQEESVLVLHHGHELIVDLFAGAGGASLGVEAGTGRKVDIAINHSEHAIRLHRLNHPKTLHYNEDIWQVDPLGATQGRPVGLLWASPSCTHFSKARGGKPVRRQERSLAWVVVKWARQVSPRIIIIENVEEFMTWGPVGADNQPIKARAGEFFRRWVSQLRQAGPGYAVEWKVLNAADYGVPTSRKRWFLIARCDGEPIVWPEATHAPADKAAKLGLKSYRSAAECIDWSLPCPSIFMSKEEAEAYAKATGQRVKRPLKPNTLRRIANGVMRYVVNAKQPFIVTCNHSGQEFRGQSLADPMRTLTGSRDASGLVVPYLAELQNASGAHGCRPVDAPMPTVTASPKGGGFALVAPTLVTNTTGHAGGPVDRPMATLTTGGHQALVAAFLAKHYGGVVGQKVDAPTGTITETDHHGLVAVTLNKHRGDSPGSSPHDPLPTITGGAGSSRPAGAAHALGITAASLVKLRGTSKDGQDADKPLLTVTGGGNHVARVAGFLQQYYSTGGNASDLARPMPAVVTKDRTGLVTVEINGQTHVIVDIGMRMLQPEELLRAQFGRFAAKYKMNGSKAQQVAGIGNSVPPEVAEAIVRSNVTIRPVSLDAREVA
jgi:DNA (cytosine-5)-methyltransferase 1